MAAGSKSMGVSCKVKRVGVSGHGGINLSGAKTIDLWREEVA